MSRLAATLRPLVLACTVAAGALLTAGCMNQQKTEQLSQVAKGWSKTIRASQVIPVYPLTEDVQVGDVFVVQRPIEDEVQVYDEEGFLPLGHHLGRVAPLDYEPFYAAAEYGITKDTKVPGFWRRVVGGNGTADGAGPVADLRQVQADPDVHRKPTNWSPAPRASFPSYSFSINRSAGINVGIPVQGVPVAFGLLGSDTASATVSLKDAYTYGLDVDLLHKKLEDWARAHKDDLADYEPVYAEDREGGGYRIRYSYLRMVTRVYMVGKVNVSVVDGSSAAADLKVGAGGVAENLKLLSASTQPIEDLRRLRDAINEGLAGATSQPAANGGQTAKKSSPAPAVQPVAAPSDGGQQPSAGGGDAPTAGGADAAPVAGGRLKLLQVTNRSVSLDETFDRPLVVGYLAFDVPIGFNGQIGTRPVATQTRLRYGGSIRNRHLVNEWVETYPHAENVINEWLQDPRNVAWLDRQKLPKTAGEILAHYDSRDLVDWLTPEPTKWKLLTRRIIAEVIEVPEGLPLGQPGQHRTIRTAGK